MTVGLMSKNAGVHKISFNDRAGLFLYELLL